MVKLTTWALAPASWAKQAKLRLVLVADIHAGAPQMSLSRVRKVVDLANSLGGDLILLLGDFLADHRFQLRPYKIEDLAKTLANLKAPLGVAAVLGNHDWRADHAARRQRQGPIKIHEVLGSHGICVLANRAVQIRAQGFNFWLAGLDSQSAFHEARRGRLGDGADNLQQTLAQVTDDNPIILMAHEPDIFPQVPPHVALTVSGHTHGGQIKFGSWLPVVPSFFGARYAYGHIHETGRDLVVSGGLGCSGLPIRFGIPPEITVVELG